MSNDQGLLSIIQSLCRDALIGKIQLQEFYARWPEAANTKSFLRQIHDDIEDGIQHTPGYLFQEGINHAVWSKSYPYLAVYLDLSLLGLGMGFEDLEQFRQTILQSNPQSPKNVDELHARLLRK